MSPSVFIYDQARAATDAQPLVSLGRLDGYDPRLAQAIRLMEAHVDRPLTVAAIARRSGVTARTLELVFSARDRRNARRLLSAPAPQCGAPARARHGRADGGHRRADRIFEFRRLSRARSDGRSARRRARCGGGEKNEK